MLPITIFYKPPTNVVINLLNTVGLPANITLRAQINVISSKRGGQMVYSDQLY